LEDPAYNHLRFESLDFSGATSLATFQCHNTHDIYVYDCIVRDSATASGVYLHDSGTAPYNITFDSCEFKNNHNNGFLCESVTCHDILVYNCYSHDNGTSIWAHHGFYVAGGIVVDHCIAYNNAYAGFKENDNMSSSSLYPVVKNSISYNNRCGLDADHVGGTFYNNLVYSNSYVNLFVGGLSGNKKIIHNTFVNSMDGTERAIIFDANASGTGGILEDNLFIQDLTIASKGVYSTPQTLAAMAAQYTIDYNIYYLNGDHTSNKFSYIVSSMTSFDDWKASGFDTHSTFLADLPDVVTRYTDMQPIVAGNLLGLGLTITGYDHDFNGVARTSPPTPGCYDNPQPEKVYYLSSSIGNVNADVLVVVFTTSVLASNYATGVTIKKGGVTQTITSAVRQTDTKIVYYYLSVPLAAGDTVTWEYNAAVGNYSNLANTYSMQTYAAQAVTNNIVDFIVNINHDTSTNLTDATNYTGSSGADISIAPAAALNGTTNGLNILIDDLTADVAWKDVTANSSGKVRARFRIDPNTITMATGTDEMVISLQTSAYAAIVYAYLRYVTTGGYRLKIATVSATGERAPTSVVIPAPNDGEHYIEFMVTRSSADGVADGRLDWWIDGNVQTAITDIDNYTEFPNFGRVKVGNIGPGAGTNGTIFLDELKINTTGVAIGA
jgi:hypothetical protein